MKLIKELMMRSSKFLTLPFLAVRPSAGASGRGRAVHAPPHIEAFSVLPPAFPTHSLTTPPLVPMQVQR